MMNRETLNRVFPPHLFDDERREAFGEAVGDAMRQTGVGGYNVGMLLMLRSAIMAAREARIAARLGETLDLGDDE